jgi:ubiquinone/menaquinone biosynthesis C-methylase UbiE
MSSYRTIRRALIPSVDFHQNHYARELDTALSDGCRWLDIGAGTKIHDGFGVPSSAELAARAGELIGVDPVGDHLARNPFLTGFEIASAEKLPFADATFDVVSANMVLEHLEDPETVFAEVSRVLKPGGRFVFVTPNLRHPVVGVSNLLISQKRRSQLAEKLEGRNAEHVFPTFYRANTTQRIESLARARGFDRTQIRVERNIPFLTGPAPLTALEALFIRATEWKPLHWLGADIVGTVTRQ